METSIIVDEFSINRPNLRYRKNNAASEQDLEVENIRGISSSTDCQSQQQQQQQRDLSFSSIISDDSNNIDNNDNIYQELKEGSSIKSELSSYSHQQRQ